MPELPEVETVRAGLATHLVGRQILAVQVRRPNLRFPFPEDLSPRLEGRTVTAIERRAKYILIRLNDDMTMLSHLGMTGRWRLVGGESADGEDSAIRGDFSNSASPVEQDVGDGKHDHLVIELAGGRRAIYTDPRRFGYIDIFDTELQNENRFLHALGPEPLSDDLNQSGLTSSLQGRRTPIKVALLDQRTVAGLGNIYVCEILHRAGISPTRKASSISSQEAARLVEHIRKVLLEAIAAGGSTLKDGMFSDVSGELGYFPTSFGVYDREGEPCLSEGCIGDIVRIVQQGRSSFYCRFCQE